MILKDKKVLLCVSGGIAAYKALELTSRLIKSGAEVKVIMTKSATEFVSPLSFQTLSKNPVAVDMFEEPKSWEVRHISLAKWADVFAVVPATANVIGKIACGIADDMLSTTVMATKSPVLIAPAMNTNMFENPIVQDNITKLKNLGYNFVMPESGRLACGDVGRGKLCDIDIIFDEITRLAFKDNQDLTGKKVLVSAGATKESIDPVRYITNHSSGKMGFSIAKAAYLRGAFVTLIAGSHSVKKPYGVDVIDVTSAIDMTDAMLSYADSYDIIIMSAAVADFRPKNYSDEKIKKTAMNNDSKSTDEMTLSLQKNPDILKSLGEKYSDKKVIVGFAMETENLLENAKKKCIEKNTDFIVANSLRTEGAGFKSDTNIATIIEKSGEKTTLPKMSKFDLANIILDKAIKIKK